MHPLRRLTRLFPTALAAACLLVAPALYAKPPLMPTGNAVLMPPTAEGEVRRLLINPYGEVDGLQLTDGRVVKFPPHMGNQLSQTVAPGQVVRVAGRFEGMGVVKADAILNVASGRITVDQPPSHWPQKPMPRHLRAAQLQSQEAEGTISTVLTGRRGEPTGVILQTGAIVRFPHHGLTTALQPGQAFAARDLGTRNAHGLALEAVSMGVSLATLQPLYRNMQ